MKKIIYNRIFVVILMLLFLCNGYAQDQRTKETKIADIVMLLPAKDTETLNKLMSDLYRLDNVIPYLAKSLAENGKGDDSRIRYALSGLAFYTSKQDDPVKRKEIASGFCEAIKQAGSNDKKDFLLIQLQYVAGDESVPTVQPLLLDQALCDPAARVLTRINTPASNDALLSALGKAGDEQKIYLVESLGYTAFEPALDAITNLAGNNNLQLQKTVLHTLAEIASASSLEILSGAARQAGFTFEQTDALGSYIIYLSNLNQKGEKTIVSKAAEELIEKSGSIVAQSAGLSIWVDSKGEKAIPEIISVLNSDHKELRNAALEKSLQITSPSMTKALVKASQKSKSPEIKAEIIHNLGERGDQSALQYVMDALYDNNTQVVKEAVLATGKIGKEQSAPFMIQVVGKSDKEVLGALKQSLSMLDGETIEPLIARTIPGASPKTQIALIQLLSQKKAKKYASVVFAQTASPNPDVRLEAEKALKNMVGRYDMDRISKLLDNATNPEEIQALKKAFYASVSDVGDQEMQAQYTIEKMNAPGANPANYVDILAMIGGNEGLSIVTQAFESPDPASRSAAFDVLMNWSDFSAAPTLYKIAAFDPSGEYFNRALLGYVAKINASDQADEQKLLLLRKALEIAQNDEQKTKIITGIGKTNTLVGMIIAGGYLKNGSEPVQQAAVQAVLNIFLTNNYYGKIVTEQVNIAIACNKDPEAEYQKAAVLKKMAALPQDPGFVSLFNGKNMDGWHGMVGNPIIKGKMSAAELSKKQVKADEIMNQNWKAENGLLVYTGSEFNIICSEKKYADFEMFVDWRIGPKGNGGVHLRGTPMLKIWDTSLKSVGAQVGSGGLFYNRRNNNKPLVPADNPVTEWNTFHVRMTGDKATVYLNGQLVVDNLYLENFWDRSLDMFPSEVIGLQSDGDRIEFRDLYIREIPKAKPYEVSEQEKKEGFKPLFNGVDMSGWTGNLQDYVVRDGSIVCDPSFGGKGNLYTEKEYSDFVLRFDFLLTPAANNGIGIRTPMGVDAAYHGMEIQVLDNTADVYKNLKIYQYHGSVYGVIPAKKDFLKPLGEWNTEEIIAQGNHIKVTLNGEVILDGDIAEASKNFTETLDGREHPGLSNKSGHIGFLGHGSYVSFKNLRIREIK